MRVDGKYRATRHMRHPGSPCGQWIDEMNMESQLAKVHICEPLVTADRAAELLKVHPKTVKRMAQAGNLPGMKIAACGDSASRR